MYRDKQLTSEQLLKLLHANVVHRNETLSTFMDMLNSVKANTYLSIDGEWGSGKSVFIKQLELLSYVDLTDLSIQNLLYSAGINETTVSEFQATYIAYYYNAWQNDDHKDPIQSLLFNLIHDYQIKDGLKDMVKNSSKQIARDSLISSVKTLSKGFVDLDSLKNIKTVRDLVKDITTSNERKEAVSNIVNILVPEGKKLLFLIDELDRCSPLFAVSMLEAVKHYYENDKIVFIIATNNKQLVHTIKKHYGNDFNGANYLNKFYDLVYELPEINRKEFISGHLKRKDDSYWYNIVPLRIADALELSMRDIVRYYSSLDIINNYLTAESNWGGKVRDITKYLFVPVALALKITDANKYAAFRSGRGTGILEDLLKKESVFTRVAIPYISKPEEDQVQQQTDIILGAYSDLFSSVSDNEGYDTREVQNHFHQAISLINSTGKIDAQ